MLTCIAIGFLVGRTTLRRSHDWCERHLKWLRKYMELKNGIASVPTMCRMLNGIDERLFVDAFCEWIGQILRSKGRHIVIDGKALIAATSRVKGSRPPMIMNALDAATGLVLAQLPTTDKGNEITAIPELLSLLDLENSIVTIDAIGTNTGIIEQIVDSGGHYLLTVKKNNPTVFAELEDFFREISRDYRIIRSEPTHLSRYPVQLKEYEEAKTSEKNRDRYEYRSYRVCNDASVISKSAKEWKSIRSVGFVRQIRIPIEKSADGKDITPDVETFLKEGSRRKKKKPVPGDGINDEIQEVGMISDRRMRAEEMGRIKRAHWTIENRLHHVLDDTFREDRSPAKKSRNNLALLRKFAYNILRLAMKAHPEIPTVIGMIDLFADDIDLVREYVFNGIPSFY